MTVLREKENLTFTELTNFGFFQNSVNAFPCSHVFVPCLAVNLTCFGEKMAIDKRSHVSDKVHGRALMGIKILHLEPLNMVEGIVICCIIKKHFLLFC